MTTRTVRMVERNVAVQNPTRHQFVPGVGYLDHGGEPNVVRVSEKSRTASPPPGCPDDSLHVLASPGGSTRVQFQWNAEHHAWTRLGGNRLGWSDVYLSAYGWTYVGPVE